MKLFTYIAANWSGVKVFSVRGIGIGNTAPNYFIGIGREHENKFIIPLEQKLRIINAKRLFCNVYLITPHKWKRKKFL